MRKGEEGGEKGKGKGRRERKRARERGKDQGVAEEGKGEVAVWGEREIENGH